MRVSILIIFVSVQAVGNFVGVQTAPGNDLRVSFENEVAGITPEMTILPLKKGTLSQPNTQITKGWDSKATYVKKGSGSISESKKKSLVGLFADAGFISNKMNPVGRVLKIFDNKLAAVGPEKLFIDIGRNQGLELGDKFTVYSRERFIFHPVIGRRNQFMFSRPRRTGFPAKKIWSSYGKPLGYTILVRGVLEVTEVGDAASCAKLVKVYEGIKPGNFLIPYQEMAGPVSSQNSNKSIEGYIVATKENRIEVGLTDIVYIDKGWEDGVEAGDVLEVYNIPEIVEEAWWSPFWSAGARKTLLLPDMLGEIKVVSVQKHTAAATIIQNNYGMQVGQKFRTKR